MSGTEFKRDSEGLFVKGTKGGPGRKVGQYYKLKIDVKMMILGALEDQDGGGRAYLARQAQENPVAFMSLLGKIIPKSVRLEGPTLEQLLAGTWDSTESAPAPN